MRFAIQLFVLSSIFLTACAWAETKIPAPNPLPRVKQEMKTAGFWIAGHPSPDDVIMTPDEIAAFNAGLREQKLTHNIFKPEMFLLDFSPAKTFEEAVQKLQSEKYFDPTGRTAKSNFFEPILQNMNTHETFLPEYGLIVHFANERILPTDDGLYESPGDVQFDQLQNSGLDIGTPVLIVHRSQDQKWIYEINEISEGWIHVENVAIGEDKTVQAFASSPDFVIATAPKADIFSDGQHKQFIGFVRMGARLPLPIQIPTRDESGRLVLQSGYMNADEIHEGYRPYTARTIANQAFAMLNQPYGWGGYNGEQDCSRFLQEVFATVGIRLPRNSKEQAQAGQPAAAFDEKTTDPQKREAFQKLTDGIYILTLKGHIMFYLGNVDGQPYAIHAIYAYRERGDVARVINRVALTDLELGEGSKKGSLLRRLTGIRKIK